MRFANTLPLIAAALVAGASNVLADDSADPSTSAVLASQPDNAGTVDHSAGKDGAWKEIRHFVGAYNFFELLNYPGARAHRHAHAKSSAAPAADPSTPAPTDSAGPASADLETGGGDAQLQQQERDFEDVEELEARKNHKKKHGKKHRKKKKHGGKKSHKKKHGKSHKKKHGKKKHNKKKHGHKHDKKKHHHKREDEGVDMVVRAYEAGDIDARMFDNLVERYNVIGDPYLDTREFIDIDDLEAREFGDLFWD